MRAESGPLTDRWQRKLSIRLLKCLVRIVILTKDLNPKGPCATKETVLIGTQHWSTNMFIKLIQHFGLETDVARHLSESYGDKAWTVASLANETGSRWPLFGRRLAPGYPYIEAEVRYACRREYACTAVDVLARRTRLSYLNARATLEALPKVIEIMASEYGWDSKRKALEAEQAKTFLLSMGLTIKEESSFPTKSLIGDDSALFIPGEIDKFHKVFNNLDASKSGRLAIGDLSNAFYNLGLTVKDHELNWALKEVELDSSKGLEFNEFLEILAAIKDSKSRKNFARTVAKLGEREQFDTTTSGGGV